MQKLLIIFVLISLLVSCDEINKIINPSDEYLIDKSIQPKTEEQKFNSGNDIEIKFPANSLKGNLELKVNKESSVPEFKIDNYKIGSNNFKIKFKGNFDFNSPIEIKINYNPSLIKSWQTASQSVKPFYYQNGTWKMLTNFQIDETNKKIILKFNNLQNPKSLKITDILQDGEGNMIFGDGYSNTDTGNQDNQIAKSKIYYIIFYSTTQTNGRVILHNTHSHNQKIDTIPITINGNSFSASFNSHPGDDPTEANPGNTFQYDYKKFNLSGEIENNNYMKIKYFNITESREYHSSQYDWSDQQSTIYMKDIELLSESKNKDTLVYEIPENQIKSKVTSFSWDYNWLWESKTYNQGLADLKKVTIYFRK